MRNIQDEYGTYDVYPYIKIIINNNPGIFALKNLNTGEVISFKNINAGDVVEMERRRVYRASHENIFADWNKEPFVLHEGENSFQVNVNCKVEIDAQYPVI